MRKVRVKNGFSESNTGPILLNRPLLLGVNPLASSSGFFFVPVKILQICFLAFFVTRIFYKFEHAGKDKFSTVLQ